MSSLEPRNAPSPSKPASPAPSNRLADAMQSAGICARNHPGYLKAKGETGPQDKPTAPYELTGPGDRREITFESYTPMVDPKHPGIFNLAPPDPSGDDARNGDTRGSVSPRAVRVATRADGSTMVRPEGWEYAIRMVAGGPEHLAPVRASGSAGDVQIGAREGESG